MRNLADTISRLKALRGIRAHAPIVAAPSRLSDIRQFGSNPGQLAARMYVPPGLTADQPLVVVLHGCTQNAAGYDLGSGWSQLADREGFAVLFPEQQRSNNANLCFNWFLASDAGRDVGEASSIRQMIAHVVDTYRCDPARVFITGLSAGGAMAATMLATYPELFAGGAIIAGLAHGMAHSVPEAFDRMRGHTFPTDEELAGLLRRASSHDGPWPTISIWHGTSDRTVHSSNALALAAQWKAVHQVQAGTPRKAPGPGYHRTIWSDANDRDVIELVAIPGLGHGIPLDTHANDKLGQAGPFMLEAGISSTLEIARFWGLAKDTAHRSVDASVSEAKVLGPLNPVSVADRQAAEASAEAAFAPTPSAARGQRDIRGIIEDALRKAGLM